MVTVITKTIGAGGGYDYATFTAAEADVENVATTAFGSTDLVANDGAIVFEAVAGTYNETVTFSSTLTTDATRNVTYKPAAGSEHGGVPGAGVHLTSTGITTAIHDDYTRLIGLSAHSSGSTVFWQPAGVGSLREDCIGHASGTSQTCFYSQGGTAAAPHVFRNCVAYTDGSQQAWFIGAFPGADGYTEAYNCTSMSRWVTVYANAATMNATLVNCMAYGVAFRTQVSNGGTEVVTGSNNFGGSTDPFPAAIQGSPYPITATTSFSTPLGSGDYAVYMGATGALANVTGNDVWQQGVGPASNPDVPTTDINGVTRSGTSCNPGAFEADGFVAPTVITKTIGAAGPPTYDYATFTLAENAVTSIGTGTDLTFYNEAIVFEAVAGSYNERLTASSTLTTDATRNVTYKAAAGSEHDGSLGSGVYLNLAGISVASIQDAHVNLRGLTISGQGYTIAGGAGSDGLVVDSCVVYSSSGLVAPSAINISVVNAAIPSTVTNTVCTTLGSPGVRVLGDAVLRNCTTIGGVGLRIEAGANNIGVEVTNYLSLSPESYQATVSTGSITLTGSNNFGGSTDPFPAAIQGTPYPITPTTDVDPGPGDWAIYDAATGALIDDPDNDVLAGGIGPDANPLVPTTDILGNTRSGATTDPGAFEISTLAPPEPALITIMRQIYQQDASFSVGASSAGVEKITHQLGPASADYFTINSTTSATVSVPRTAHALRVICVVAQKACDVTLDLDASNSVFLGSIGGVASVQTDLTYFWSFGQVVSDGTYPRVRIVNDGFAGDQLVYLWWHLA